MKYLAFGFIILFGITLTYAVWAHGEIQRKTVELVAAKERADSRLEVVRWKAVYVPVRVETKAKEIMQRKVGDDECQSALQLLREFQ